MGKSRINRCQNLRPNFAQAPEQSDFTYGVYLVAAGHLKYPFPSFVFFVCRCGKPVTGISYILFSLLGAYIGVTTYAGCASYM